MRRASIDLGSNSFLLTVAEVSDARQSDRVADEIIEVLDDHLIVVRLGQGVDASGVLAAEAMERGIDALRVFRARCDDWGIAAKDVRTGGTSALREASNRDVFVSQALAETGFVVRVIPGQQEAWLSYQGALTSLALAKDAAPCLLDIGGGSTELVWADGQERYSMPLGVVRARERYLSDDPPTSKQTAALVADVQNQLAGLPSLPAPKPLIAVAGTPTSLVAVADEMEVYDGSHVHGQRLTLATIQALTARFCSMDATQRKAVKGLHPQRADLIIPGALILSSVMIALNQEEVLVSDRGLRYGLLLE